MENNNSCINLGGKGSSLSSSSVFAIANDLAKLGFENSALQRLAIADSRYGASVKPYKLDFPNLLTLEEKKTALVVIFNNLLLFSAATDTIRSILPSRISSALDDTSRPLEIDLTEEEVRAVEILRSISVLYGAIALVDHKSSALSAIADAVAAISCESSRSDVSAFELTDPGDGSTDKDEIGIAADVKVLLNGSKLVGKAKSEEAVSRIPKVHAFLRKQSRLVHSVARVELKSAVKSGSGAADTVRNLFSSLATALWDFGRYSYGRAKLNLDSMVDGDVKSSLVGLFEEKCPSADTLRSESKVVSELVFGGEENYDSLGHQANALVGLVWKIVAWEAITAFVALEGAELKEKSQDGEVTSVSKKSEKKKKVVLGKGTSVLIQVIKNRLGSKVSGSDGSGGLLEKWVEELLLFFNPKDIEFDNLLSKVKEIVEGNEARRLPKPPKGTRDFSKEQMTVRKKAFSIIEDVFEKHGATALDTPVFELSDVLKGKYGEDSKLIYDLADQGGEHLSLRYDLTVPFARHMASNGLTSLKRYQIGKVYRRDNPSKGRYREFYQCDFDIAGQYERMGPDFEVVKILTELLDKLNIGDYEIKLNHRRLLDGMLEICGVPPEKFRAICSSIDKLDKQSFDQIKIEMVEEKGLTGETADKIGTFVKERGPPLELFGKLKREGSKFLENCSSIDALNDLEILFEALEKSKCINRVTFDLSLARGLDYYTGVIFEAVFRGGTQVGSIAAGGRYDNLIGMFGSKQVPAVGMSLGIERVFTIMEQLQKDQNQKMRASKTDVLVSILGDDLSQAAELVSELWDAEMYAEFSVSKRLNKHFDRAKESKIPWMLIQGERERNEGRVRIKDFESSNEDVVVPRSRVVEELKARLNLQNDLLQPGF